MFSMILILEKTTNTNPNKTIRLYTKVSIPIQLTRPDAIQTQAANPPTVLNIASQNETPDAKLPTIPILINMPKPNIFDQSRLFSRVNTKS
jgi:hypothetical protein